MVQQVKLIWYRQVPISVHWTRKLRQFNPPDSLRFYFLSPTREMNSPPLIVLRPLVKQREQLDTENLANQEWLSQLNQSWRSRLTHLVTLLHVLQVEVWAITTRAAWRTSSAACSRRFVTLTSLWSATLLVWHCRWRSFRSLLNFATKWIHFWVVLIMCRRTKIGTWR